LPPPGCDSALPPPSPCLDKRSVSELASDFCFEYRTAPPPFRPDPSWIGLYLLLFFTYQTVAVTIRSPPPFSVRFLHLLNSPLTGLFRIDENFVLEQVGLPPPPGLHFVTFLLLHHNFFLSYRPLSHRSFLPRCDSLQDLKPRLCPFTRFRSFYRSNSSSHVSFLILHLVPSCLLISVTGELPDEFAYHFVLHKQIRLFSALLSFFAPTANVFFLQSQAIFLPFFTFSHNTFPPTSYFPPHILFPTKRYYPSHRAVCSNGTTPSLVEPLFFSEPIRYFHPLSEIVGVKVAQAPPNCPLAPPLPPTISQLRSPLEHDSSIFPIPPLSL